MSVSKITVLNADDWTALYKDGVKVEENHSISLTFGLKALDIEFEEREVEVDDLGNAPDGSDPFPERLP